MSGLLDFLNTPDGQLGLGLLAAAGPRADGAGFGQRITEGFGYAQKQQDDAMRRKFQQAQMEEARAAMLDRQRKQAQDESMRAAREKFFAQNDPTSLARDSALSNGQGPTIENAAAMNNVDPRHKMLFEAAQSGAMPFGDYVTATAPKEQKYQTVGNNLLAVGPDGVKPVFTAPEKNDPNKPFNSDGTPNKLVQAFLLNKSKAGAIQLPGTKIEVKTGESVGAQVGPMLKDSRTAAGGAVKMADSAQRILTALDSGQVSSGPLASTAMTVKQFLGLSPDNVQQTRRVIRALAESSLEARKELAGQGQVTENEAKAVEKAMSGNIDDLTTGELRDIAHLNLRAAKFRAMSHQKMLDTMGENQATKGLVPFYKVQGLEGVLKLSTELPTLGGGGSVIDQADAILRGNNGKR